MEPLVGLAETAELLNWDKRKVSTYIKKVRFLSLCKNYQAVQFGLLTKSLNLKNPYKDSLKAITLAKRAL